jgi:hypothetical protein
MMEILVYGLKAGETERYMEDLLSSRCRTPADVEAVKAAASKDGWHSFRVAEYNGEAPNFAAISLRCGN